MEEGDLPNFRHTFPALQFLATDSMRKSNVVVGYWLPFYIDERQTNSLFAHEQVKIAVPVSVI